MRLLHAEGMLKSCHGDSTTWQLAGTATALAVCWRVCFLMRLHAPVRLTQYRADNATQSDRCTFILLSMQTTG